MSARVSRGAPPKSSGRNSQRRKMVLDVDLNVPPCERPNEVGTSSQPPGPQEVRAGQQAAPPQSIPIDVDSIVDDDVVLSSPRAFAEAKSKSRRNRGRSNVVDVDLESTNRLAATNRNKRQRGPTNGTIINCESYVNLERNANGLSGNGNCLPEMRSVLPPPPPPPPEPKFSCPICMGPLVEEMSTKCGHIFCKGCIKSSIAAQGKCPTCRRKVTMKDTIRIYLPATS